MRELVFLLEEKSAKAMLESLLPRVLQPTTGFRCIPFEGKQDLEKQLVRKIRGYQNPRAKFIVLRDQDSHPDCHAVKAKLVSLCAQSGKGVDCLVRIACRELEAFYLADLSAVEQALRVSGLAKHQNSRKFRNPETLGSPSQELKELTKFLYEKVASSREIGLYLDATNTRSAGFHSLMGAIRRWEEALAEDEA